jgi:hypothetical protein
MGGEEELVTTVVCVLVLLEEIEGLRPWLWASSGLIWALGPRSATRGGFLELVTTVVCVLVLSEEIEGLRPWPDWRRKKGCFSLPCGVSEYCSFVNTTKKRCGDGSV